VIVIEIRAIKTRKKKWKNKSFSKKEESHDL
jgi:hypothetical protein